MRRYVIKFDRTFELHEIARERKCMLYPIHRYLNFYEIGLT